MDKKPLTIEVLKFIIYIVSIAVAVVIFYGSLDRRVTIVETEMIHKVDDKKLFEKLDQLKEDLSAKIETEINKINK